MCMIIYMMGLDLIRVTKICPRWGFVPCPHAIALDLWGRLVGWGIILWVSKLIMKQSWGHALSLLKKNCIIRAQKHVQHRLMAQCKTAVTSLLENCGYCSLALSHRNDSIFLLEFVKCQHKYLFHFSWENISEHPWLPAISIGTGKYFVRFSKPVV